MTQFVGTSIFRPQKISLLQGEWKPLHTNFSCTLLPVRSVRATTTTVTTKNVTRARKIKTKRQQTLHTRVWTTIGKTSTTENLNLMYYFRLRTPRFWLKKKVAIIKPLRSQGPESIGPLAFSFNQSLLIVDLIYKQNANILKAMVSRTNCL